MQLMALLNLSKLNWLRCNTLALLLVIAPGAGAGNDELRHYLRTALHQPHHFKDQYDAQVWLLDKSQRMRPFIKEPKRRLSLLTAIHSAAKQTQLPPELVLALIETESSFKQYAISKAGAQGLMQVMPFWKHEIGRPDDNLTDIQTNLRYGCTILKYYLERHPNSIANALAAYNGSLGRTVYSDKVLNALARWQ